jgi:hypothetical protein
MLYYGKDINLTECKTCGHALYKPNMSRGRTLIAYKKMRHFSITPRIQRLFISPNTSKHMTWYHSHDAKDGVMVHPCNDEACK